MSRGAWAKIQPSLELIDALARRHAGRELAARAGGGVATGALVQELEQRRGVAERGLRPVAMPIAAPLASIKRDHARQRAEIAAKIVYGRGEAVEGRRLRPAEAHHHPGGALDRGVVPLVVVPRPMPLAAGGGDL